MAIESADFELFRSAVSYRLILTLQELMFRKNSYSFTRAILSLELNCKVDRPREYSKHQAARGATERRWNKQSNEVARDRRNARLHNRALLEILSARYSCPTSRSNPQTHADYSNS